MNADDEFYDAQDYQDKEQQNKQELENQQQETEKKRLQNVASLGNTGSEDVSRVKVSGADLDLHRACFNNDIEKIDELLSTWDREKWTTFDSQGNPAIHVAVLKGNVDAVKKLLEYNYPYNLKNESKWKPLMAAIAQKDETMARAIIHYRIDVLRKLREKQIYGLVEVFLSLPDCSFKIHWDFNSFFLWPLLKRFAPQDTYLVWKRGPEFRIDATMLGMDNKSTSLLPQWKRGHFSMLLDASDKLNPRVCLLDRIKKQYWDVTTEVRAKLEGGDTEGTFKGHLDDMQVNMMMKNGARKHYLKSETFTFAPLKNWVGEDRVEKIDVWKSTVYQLEGQLVTVRKIKQRVVIPPDASFDDYLELELPQDYVREINVDPLKGLPGKGDKAALSEQDAEELGIPQDMYQDAMEHHPQSGADKDDGNASSGFVSPDGTSPRGTHNEDKDPFKGSDQHSNNNKPHSANNSFTGSLFAPFNVSSKAKSATLSNTLRFGTGKQNKSLAGEKDSQGNQARKITCKCWMTQNFPISLTQFLPILTLVSTTNKVIEKVSEFIEKYGKQNLFPVKVQVPLVFTIYITLSTLKFEILSPEAGKELGADFFNIPKDYEQRDVEESMQKIFNDMHENADDAVAMRDNKTGDEWFEQDNAGTRLFTALQDRRTRKLQQQKLQQEQKQQQQQQQATKGSKI